MIEIYGIETGLILKQGANTTKFKDSGYIRFSTPYGGEINANLNLINSSLVNPKNPLRTKQCLK